MSQYKTKREIADSLEKYFSERLLAPLAEREKEAVTNKAFYLGSKEFVYYSTVLGHEPERCWFCDERLDYCECGNEL